MEETLFQKSNLRALLWKDNTRKELLQEYQFKNDVKDLMLTKEVTYLTNNCTTEPVLGINFHSESSGLDVIKKTSVNKGATSATWLASWENDTGGAVIIEILALLNSSTIYSADTIYSDDEPVGGISVSNGNILDVYWTHTWIQGTLTSGSDASTSNAVLTDGTKTWTPDAFIGYRLLIGSTYYYIIDNDATTITCSSNIGSLASVTYSVVYGYTNANLLSYMVACFTTSAKTSPVRTFQLTRSVGAAITNVNITPTSALATSSVVFTANATNSSGSDARLTSCGAGTLSYAISYYSNFPFTSIVSNTCDSTTGSTLTDISESWVVNAYTGYSLLVGGKVFTIASNTATEITTTTSIGTLGGVPYVVFSGKQWDNGTTYTIVLTFTVAETA